MLLFDKMTNIIGEGAALFIGGDSAALNPPKASEYCLTPGYGNV